MKYWCEASGKTRQLQKTSSMKVKEVVACAESISRTESSRSLFWNTRQLPQVTGGRVTLAPLIIPFTMLEFAFDFQLRTLPPRL